MGSSAASRISSRWRFVTGTSAVGTRYSSSRVTTYIWSSLSGIWPVLLAGELLAPDADRDIGLLAADRDVRVGRVGDVQEQVLERGLGTSQRRVKLADPLAGRGRGGSEVGDLGAVGRGPALDRLADLL